MKWSIVTLGSYLGEQAFLKRVTLEVDGERAKVVCGYCRGGGFDNWGRSFCHICYGQGVTRVRTPLTRCGFCRGLGRPTANVALTCAVCGGKGVLTLPRDSRRCAVCRGTGRNAKQASCPCCSGRGFTG
jgi:DnaJ-class molecular chaperone